MIKIQKKQLSSLYLFLALSFFLFLIGFFVYATEHRPIFFIVLIIAQLIIIIFLASFNNRLIRRRAQSELQKQDYIEKTNLLQVGIDSEKLVLEAYKKEIVSYSKLKDLTEQSNLCLSLSDTSNMLSSEVAKLFGGEDVTAILYLFQSKTGDLGISSSQKGQMRVNLKSKKGDIFDEWVVKTMQPLFVEDTKRDFRFDIEKNKPEESRNIRSLISAPLMIGDKALGILRMDSPYEKYFSVQDLRFLATISDLGAVAIENAQLYERIEELAVKDSLTGLYLRRYLLERLGEEISRQLRRKKPLSFLMIDLDKFKQYNDQFGHMAGDIVLKTVSMILSDAFKDPGSLVCRFGGEEFAVLLPDYSKEQAIKLADDVRKTIKKQDIILRKQITHITVSVGVATFPEDAQVKDELIHKADTALYEAKSKGRDRVCSL